MSTEAHGAERAILSIIIKDPEKLFEINDIISEADFSNTGSSMIFTIVKDLAPGLGKTSIDPYLILSTAEAKGLSDFLTQTIGGELVFAICKMSTNPSNLKRYVADVKQASIKRALINKCDDLKQDIDEYVGPSIELRSMVETSILDCLKSIDGSADDIDLLSNGFEDTVNFYADRDGQIGIDVGFPRWQEDIGHIRNGAITGLFARSKVGKSQFSMWAAFKAAIEQKKPVLYLDTELQARQQQMRLCGIISGIPYNIIESGQWKGNRSMVDKIYRAFDLVKDAPLYYKNIAGRPLSYVIPTIRKFVYKNFGGPLIGDDPKCLVIYDYIKLMSSNDLGKNMQEYQLIGLLLSGLHDCAAGLNVPIIALGQLNKQEEVGIDRIVHNVDSVTILRPKKPEEIETDGQARGSHAMEVTYSRNGPGHDFGEWINVHFDKSCGQFKEDKKNSETQSVVSQIKKKVDVELKKFSSVKEEEF